MEQSLCTTRRMPALSPDSSRAAGALIWAPRQRGATRRPGEEQARMDAGRPRHGGQAGGWGGGGRAAGAHAGGADARAAAVGVGGAGVGAGAAVVGVGLQVGAEGAAAGLALGQRGAEAGGDAVAGHALRRLRARARAPRRVSRGPRRACGTQGGSKLQVRLKSASPLAPGRRGAGAGGLAADAPCAAWCERARAAHSANLRLGSARTPECAACMQQDRVKSGSARLGRRPGRLPPMRSTVGT